MSFFYKQIDGVLYYHQSQVDSTWSEQTWDRQIFHGAVSSTTLAVAPYSETTQVEGISQFDNIFDHYSYSEWSLEALTEVDLSGFVAGNGGNVQLWHVLSYAPNVSLLKFPRGVLHLGIVDTRGLIAGPAAPQLTIDGSGCSLTSSEKMFDHNSLSKVTLVNFGASNWTNFAYMFTYSSVEEVDMSSIDVRENYVNLTGMFNNCKKLKRVIMPRFDKVGSSGLWQQGPLAYCFSWTALNNDDNRKLYVDFNNSTPWTLKLMFTNCEALDLYITGLYWGDVINDSRGCFQDAYMQHIFVERDWPTGFFSIDCFKGCTALVGQPDGFSYDASKIGGEYARINDGQDGYFSPLFVPDYVDITVTPPGAAVYTKTVEGSVVSISWSVGARYDFLNAVLLSPSGATTRYDSLPTQVVRTEQGLYRLGVNFSGGNPYDGGGGSTPAGGGGSWDTSSDVIPLGDLPTLGLSSISNLYKVTPAQLDTLSTYLFSISVDTVFGNPIQYITSLGIVPFSPPIGGSDYINFGRWTSDATAYTISDRWFRIDFGSINVREFSGSFLDYSPHTTMEIYLPYIGYHQLDVNDFQSSSIQVYYDCDVMTGDFIAKVLSGGSVVSQYTGNLLTTIPVYGQDFGLIGQGIVSAIKAGAIGAMTGGVAGAAMGVAGVAADVAMQADKVPVDRGSGQGPTSGLLSVQTPYVRYSIPRQIMPDSYAQDVGIPLHVTMSLVDLSGYTQCSDVHIDLIDDMTSAEASEIERLLEEGVYL